jgi:hypothetical protein
MIGRRYVLGLCWGGFVRIVPGTGVPGDSPVWRIRIVNFLKRITELPGRVRSLSGCRYGRDSVFRAGWIVNQGRFYRRLASNSGYERLSIGQSPRGADADFPPAVR